MGDKKEFKLASWLTNRFNKMRFGEIDGMLQPFCKVDGTRCLDAESGQRYNDLEIDVENSEDVVSRLWFTKARSCESCGNKKN